MAPYPMRLRVIDVPGSVKVPPRLAVFKRVDPPSKNYGATGGCKAPWAPRSFTQLIVERKPEGSFFGTLVPECGNGNAPERGKLNGGQNPVNFPSIIRSFH